MTTQETYDGRKYTICCPHDGQRGDAYTRRFRPDFINGLWDDCDEFSSLAEHALGTDDGGHCPVPEVLPCIGVRE